MKRITISRPDSEIDAVVEAARSEPVVVVRGDDIVGVMLSVEAFEDRIWGEAALSAHEEGYLSADESKDLMNRLLRA